MLAIDNTDKLKKIMKFKPGCYYKFVALIRQKDWKNLETNQVDTEDFINWTNCRSKPLLTCKDKKEIFVKDWYIDSQEMLDKTLPDMLTVTEMFCCRLYMCTDRKSTAKTLIQIRDNTNKYLDQLLENPKNVCSARSIRRIAASASNVSESSDKDDRRWMFDVDTKDESVVRFIKKHICKEFYIDTLKTKNGYHILAKKQFRTDLFSSSNFEALHNYYIEVSENTIRKYADHVEIKDNAMCLIAMGMDEMSCKLNITGVNMNSEENND